MAGQGLLCTATRTHVWRVRPRSGDREVYSRQTTPCNGHDGRGVEGGIPYPLKFQLGGMSTD
jgi:hypothetical protein